jgi:farnesyl-diphosphate farnesyltransferase
MLAPATENCPSNMASEVSSYGDEALQAHLLQGVSRTFALTIPQLPPALAKPVANAYLLCRIVDTIEDEVALSPAQKRKFCRQFVRVVRGDEPAEPLSRELGPLLSEVTILPEHELIRLIPRVVAITQGLEMPQKDALALCVEIMAGGMAEFQERDLSHGLSTLDEMNDYCYYVAGVVGEMLTRLFCHYSPDIAAHREEMMKLAVSFGQGLQMTNILKDLWDDHGRGVCWLPQDVFTATGFNLRDLKPGHDSPEFRRGFRQLVGIAHGHLRNALAYTLFIPAREAGLREFCLWALGMAVLTLRKINNNLDFDASAQVKITRRAVKATVLTSRLCRSSDTLLKMVFCVAGFGLPQRVCEKRSERPEGKEPGAQPPECTEVPEDGEHRATPPSGRAVASRTPSQGNRQARVQHIDS